MYMVSFCQFQTSAIQRQFRRRKHGGLGVDVRRLDRPDSRHESRAVQRNQTTTSLITANSGGSWTDYVYEARLRMPITNANAGLVFRVQDANNYYMYRIHSSNQQLELFKSVNGQLTLVNSTPFTAIEKQWYKVKAVMQGNTISCYVDGELKMEWTNPVTELTAGDRIPTTSAGVHFDDALVSLLNKAPEEIALSHHSVVENTTAGGMVGTFSTSDLMRKKHLLIY